MCTQREHVFLRANNDAADMGPPPGLVCLCGAIRFAEDRAADDVEVLEAMWKRS